MWWLYGGVRCKLEEISRILKKETDDIRCRQTGQNHPLAFLFLLGLLVVGVAGAAAVGVAVSVAPPSAGGVVPSPAAAGVTPPSEGLGPSCPCVIVPPAPNSIILIAQSLHATRCRHGSKTTSRGEERQTRHSDDGSASSVATVAGAFWRRGTSVAPAVAGVAGGYVWSPPGRGAVGAGAETDEVERP